VYLLLRRPMMGINGASPLLSTEVASGELAADEESRQRGHKGRSHEAPVNGIVRYRFAIQHSPDQNPALDAINIGSSKCGRTSLRQPRSSATNGLFSRASRIGERLT